jgi:glycosyltransferase involved in cell wall biosynthesis
VFFHGAVRVERVSWRTVPFITRSAVRVVGLARLGPVKAALTWYGHASALAQAMERRHQDAPFDIVQSADYRAAGMAVRRLPGRVHVMRCSNAADLYNPDLYTSGPSRGVPGERYRERLEAVAIRRADAVYCPSKFIADHLGARLGMPVGVVRPPRPPVTAAASPDVLRERYFIHFGQLSPIKGTAWLAGALKHVFEADPTFRMVWIGRGKMGDLKSALDALGPYRANVLLVYPMPKAVLHGWVRGAEAAVLPSLVDNLPNTVIECLTLGIPVIGSAGASIDELVEPGITGELVPIGNERALADAILKVWTGRSSARKGFQWSGPVADSFDPVVAIENWVQFARSAGSPAETPVVTTRISRNVL